MRIKLSSGTVNELKPTKYPKALEKKFAKANVDMVRAMATFFKNNTIKKLNQGDIEKFADEVKPGNYALVFKKLSRVAKSKLLKRFSTERLKAFTREFTAGVNTWASRDFYGKVTESMGIDREQLMKNEALTPEFNALTEETFTWVEKLRDDILRDMVASTLRDMALGKSLGDILVGFDRRSEEKFNRANTMARTQIATYNSLSTKIRAQKLGITQAKWITSRDERVRPCHVIRDKKVFDLAEGLYSSCDRKTLLPGVDYNCRCTYAMIIPDEDEGDE